MSDRSDVAPDETAAHAMWTVAGAVDRESGAGIRLGAARARRQRTCGLERRGRAERAERLPAVRRARDRDPARGAVAVLVGHVDVAVRRDGDRRVVHGGPVDDREDRGGRERRAVRGVGAQDRRVAVANEVVGPGDVDRALARRRRAVVHGDRRLVHHVRAVLDAARGTRELGKREAAVRGLREGDRGRLAGHALEERVVDLAGGPDRDRRAPPHGDVGGRGNAHVRERRAAVARDAVPRSRPRRVLESHEDARAACRDGRRARRVVVDVESRVVHADVLAGSGRGETRGGPGTRSAGGGLPPGGRRRREAVRDEDRLPGGGREAFENLGLQRPREARRRSAGRAVLRPRRERGKRKRQNNRDSEAAAAGHFRGPSSNDRGRMRAILMQAAPSPGGETYSSGFTAVENFDVWPRAACRWT